MNILNIIKKINKTSGFLYLEKKFDTEFQKLQKKFLKSKTTV